MTKKNIIFLSVSLVLIILLGIGVSYSMWNISVSQNTNNTAYTKCFDVSISGSKNNIELKNAYPITDDSGKKLIPFSFTITNTCDIFASYTVNLESLKETTLSSKYLKAMLNNEEVKKLSDYEVTDTVNDGSIESYTLAKGSLGSGDSEDYTLRLWIDYATTMADLNNEVKLFKSRIVVKAQPSTWNPVSEGYTTLHDAILANEYQTSPETAIKKIEAKGTPDFSTIAPAITYEEKLSSDLTEYTVLKPHPSIIGKSEYGAGNLSSLDSFPGVSESYYFDEKTGLYKLLNMVKKDVTELDFKNNNYYICGSGTNLTGSELSIYNDQSCSDMKKIMSVTKTAVGESNTNTYRIKYIMKVYENSQKAMESDNSDKGLYSTNDINGASYYYRGNISNNNVYFAGYYWQVIRINGDGSVRLIYNGKVKNAKGIEKNIENNAYNLERTSPAYAGYMYGSVIGTKESNYKNEVDSNIKSIIDLWYENNILNNNLSEFLYDTGYCNDRSIYSGDGITTTIFAPKNRSNNHKPDLNCASNDDLFTTSKATFGNKSLKYPIALPTIDELMLAGLVKDKVNYLNYLYSGTIVWTMSPTQFGGFKSANAAMIYKNGSIHDSDYTDDSNWGVQNLLGIRPVISLKSTTEISGGIGTINDPFVVKTN